MAEMTLVIGATAHGSDGYSGEVRSLVIDPRVGKVTHLVVEPRLAHGPGSGLARLVPLDHVDAATGEIGTGEIGLRYTEAEFKNLDPAEQTLAEFVPDYAGPIQLLPGAGWTGAGSPVVDGAEIAAIREMETVPIVPETPDGTPEVTEYRGDRVHATDGDIGSLRALRISAEDGRVTSILLKEGHLWGSKEVAIPIGNVTGFEGGIKLNLTKEQVKDLPPVDQ
jgi:sporulation protein YlmC with PRC-barrel domain